MNGLVASLVTMISMKRSVQLPIVFLSVVSAAILAASGAEPVKKNVIVYYESGPFAGWPANNGVWSWGNEILVGFSRGHFKANEDGHSIDRDKETHAALARSLDGGTWDLGYTRTVVRPDGKLVTIYYFTTAEKPEQHIAATIWQPPTTP